MSRHTNYQIPLKWGNSNIVLVKFLPFEKYERRKAIFRCPCGNEFIAGVAEARFGRVKLCKECWHRLRHENFIIKAHITHGNRYDYSIVKYVSATDPVEIICNIHGSFFQTPDNHIHGKGCTRCNKPGWRTKSEWIISAKKRICYLYLARFYNENESFLKIGITSQPSAKIRLGRNNPYSFDIITYITGSAGFIYDMERKILKMFKSYKYNPVLKFGGKTECFDYNIKETIIYCMKIMMPTAR